MVVNRRGTVPAVLITMLIVSVVAGCTSQQPPAPERDNAEPTSPVPTPPSEPLRKVPPKQRITLLSLSPAEVCELISPETLAELAFPVEQGQPREVSAEPPVRGCVFESTDSDRAIVISAQPAGLGTIGRTELDIARTQASKILHANDCTVYVGVSGATLQVSVAAPRADDQECKKAEAIASYIVPELSR